MGVARWLLGGGRARAGSHGTSRAREFAGTGRRQYGSRARVTAAGGGPATGCKSIEIYLLNINLENCVRALFSYIFE